MSLRGKPIGNGRTLPVGSYEPTGIVGLRLFPNPDFDGAAAKRWDSERYYTDPTYYNDPKLVRPYRVGMSCGFCLSGRARSIRPPIQRTDPAHPQWADLNSTVGAQYLWLDRLFSYAPDYTAGDSNFLDQLLRTYKPGTMDTSLVSTDYINNPRTMNAVYNLLPRLELAKRWGKEILKGGELNNKQLPGYFDPPNVAWSPRVLLNNRLGPFSEDPSVESRMAVFQASIEQLLRPEKRPHDTLPSGAADRVPRLRLQRRSTPSATTSTSR